MSTNALPTFLLRVADFVVQPLARLAAREKLARELNDMSDRELADIGIGRSDIDSIVEGSYQPTRGPAKPAAANQSQAFGKAVAA